MGHTQLTVRDALVRTRTRYVAVIKALVRRDGLRLPSGNPEHTERKLAALEMLRDLTRELAPLRAVWGPLHERITGANDRRATLAAADPVVAQLMTAPGIGPVTAAAFVATLDCVTRFPSAHQVEAYLGLTPSEYSSGEQQRRGRISKTGNARMRYLLVEAAWRVLRTTAPSAGPLKTWAEGIELHRGRSIAAVALARRLAGSLYAMWRAGKDYRAPRPAAQAVTVA